MKKSLVILAAFLVCQPAFAHFIWIVPGPDGSAKMVFSDSLEPDTNVAITKIAKSSVWARTDAVKSIPVTMAERDDFYQLAIAGKVKPGAEFMGSYVYGVLNKKGDPYLLNYYAKATVGPIATTTKTATALPLEIVALEKGKFAVLWQGKVATDVEVFALTPKNDSAQKLTIEKDGSFAPAGILATPGLVGMRARFIEKKAGELDGKKFSEVRHYTTWTFAVGNVATSK